jgi:Fe-S-cluster containining protein
MSINELSRILGVPYPQCKCCGKCCYCVTPSFLAEKLLELAKDNKDIARDFLCIFIPYQNIDEVRKVEPEMVEKVIAVASDAGIGADRLVFYHCRFLSEDNKCLIHEDRPDLCRVYPESHFIVLHPGCAYEEWADVCKIKYKELLEKREAIRKSKQELIDLINQRKNEKGSES